MTKKLGIAILGCGRIGKVHSANVATMPGVKLVSIYDPDMKAARNLAKDLDVVANNKIEEVYDDPAVDAIIICSPTPTHTQIIKRAVVAGKKVLCEKPLAGSLKESMNAMEFVAKHKGLLMVGFNRPFDDGFYNLRHRVAKNEVGKVEHVATISRDPGPPPIDYIKSSGGIFLDMMIHDLEMVLRLLPEPPMQISVMGSAMVDKAIGEAGDYDSALVAMQCANGCTASIHNSRRASYGYDQRVEVFGSKGMLQAKNFQENNIVIANHKGFGEAPLQNFFLERYKNAYCNLVMTFVNAIKGDRKAMHEVRTTNGINAIYLAEQAAKADRTGKPVKLQLPLSAI